MDSSLADAIRYVVEDAVVGEPLRAGLAATARRNVDALLFRRGVRGARVTVTQVGAGFEVEVAIPRVRRVERVVVRVG